MRRAASSASEPARSAPRGSRTESSLGLVSDLWVTHLGLVPYEEGLALQESSASGAGPADDPGPAAGARASARLHAGQAHARPPICRWARTGIARGASTSATTDRGGRVTYHGPGQLVAYPIMAIDRVADFVHTMEQAIVDALGDEGIEAEVRETPFTGRLDRRRQDRVHRGAGVRRRHHARAGGQRGQRPRALRLDRALRHRPGADDLGRAGDRPRAARCPASAGGSPTASPARSGGASGSCPPGACSSARSVAA